MRISSTLMILSCNSWAHYSHNTKLLQEINLLMKNITINKNNQIQYLVKLYVRNYKTKDGLVNAAKGVYKTYTSNNKNLDMLDQNFSYKHWKTSRIKFHCLQEMVISSTSTPICQIEKPSPIFFYKPHISIQNNLQNTTSLHQNNTPYTRFNSKCSCI